MGNRGRGNNTMPGLNPGIESMPCSDEQRHVHELQGSVMIADEEEPHNHRFCTVTGEAMSCGSDDHVHNVAFRTDFYEDHFHEFVGRTCGAIPVGDRHVHFIDSVTSVNDGHRHAFKAATLIDNPIGENNGRDECHNRDERHGRDNNCRR